MSVLLKHIDVGDRVLKGRLELFTTKERLKSERRLSDMINKEMTSSPKWLMESPIGPMQSRDTKELLVNLLSTMNQCFPDYDFSSLGPDKFSQETDFVSVYNQINYHLAFQVERSLPGFLQDLWTAIRDAVRLDQCQIYAYKSGEEGDPFTDEGCLSSFDYFFWDKAQDRILFFSCMTNSKDGGGSEDDDEGMDSSFSQNSFAADYDEDDDDDDLADGEVQFG